MGKGKDTRLLKLSCVENVHIRTLKKSMNSFGFIWLYIILSFTGASDVEYLSKTNNLKWKKTITMRKPIKIVFYFSTKMKTNTVKTRKYYIGLLAATTCNAKNVVYWQSNPSANLFLCLFCWLIIIFRFVHFLIIRQWPSLHTLATPTSGRGRLSILLSAICNYL